MKKFIFIFTLLLLTSCSSQRFYTDTYLIKMKDGKVFNLKNSYWDRFDMDSYKMEWLLKKEKINPDSVESIDFGGRTFVKFKKNSL